MLNFPNFRSAYLWFPALRSSISVRCREHVTLGRAHDVHVKSKAELERWRKMPLIANSTASTVGYMKASILAHSSPSSHWSTSHTHITHVTHAGSVRARKLDALTMRCEQECCLIGRKNKSMWSVNFSPYKERVSLSTLSHSQLPFLGSAAQMGRAHTDLCPPPDAARTS